MHPSTIRLERLVSDYLCAGALALTRRSTGMRPGGPGADCHRRQGDTPRSRHRT